MFGETPRGEIPVDLESQERIGLTNEQIEALEKIEGIPVVAEEYLGLSREEVDHIIEEKIVPLLGMMRGRSSKTADEKAEVWDIVNSVRTGETHETAH